MTRERESVAPLAVLMPAYNEAAGIEDAVNEVRQEVLDKLPGAYLIVVNDGSKDNTGEILERIAKVDPRVRVINKPNSGHGPSIIRALNEADSEYVFTIDSDMQMPLDCFSQFWQAATAPGCAGVFGVRSHRQDPLVRLVLSRVVAFTMSSVFKVKLRDSNVPFKLFKRKIWTELYARLKDDTLLTPSIAIAIYARKHGYNIVDMPVSHRARKTGEPSLRITKLIAFCAQAFRQMMKIKEQI
jgi:glycosyltransferase involved in cell wall biosynthesis